MLGLKLLKCYQEEGMTLVSLEILLLSSFLFSFSENEVKNRWYSAILKRKGALHQEVVSSVTGGKRKVDQPSGEEKTCVTVEGITMYNTVVCRQLVKGTFFNVSNIFCFHIPFLDVKDILQKNSSFSTCDYQKIFESYEPSLSAYLEISNHYIHTMFHNSSHPKYVVISLSVLC
jgi:hypothetical protein